MPKMNLEFQLPYEIKKEGDWYVSSCPILDVYAQGKTEKQAKDNLVETLFLFFLSCFKRGTIDEVLKDCGFEVEKKQIKEIKSRYVAVSIPFSVKHSKSLAPCHA